MRFTRTIQSMKTVLGAALALTLVSAPLTSVVADEPQLPAHLQAIGVKQGTPTDIAEVRGTFGVINVVGWGVRVGLNGIAKSVGSNARFTWFSPSQESSQANNASFYPVCYPTGGARYIVPPNANWG